MTQIQIVAVHGTNASDSKTRGDQWWQRGSAFSEGVLKYLDVSGNRVVWIPYRWSGDNSEDARESAAADLRRDLRQERPELPAKVVLIGHSHGGNVCARSLDGQKERVRRSIRTICVGTPVFGISYTYADAFYNALKIFVFLSVSALAALYLQRDLLAMPPIMQLPDMIYVAFSISAFVFFQSAPIFGRFLTEIFRLSSKRLSAFQNWIERISTKTQGGDAQSGVNLVRLFSEHDEAINGLRNIARQKFRIATPEITRAPATVILMVAFFAVLVVSIPADWTKVISGAEAEIAQNSPPRIAADNSISETIKDELKTGLSPIAAWQVTFKYVYVKLGLNELAKARIDAWYVVSSTIPAGILALIASYLGGARLLSLLVNLLFRTNALTRAFGLGSGIQSRWTAAPNPQYALQRELWRPLPIKLDRLIAKRIDKEAASTLRSAREEIGIASVMRSKGLLEAISSSISWKELYHTTYFDDEEFQRFFAYILVEKFGLPPSAEYQALNKSEFERWYNEIEPEPV